ncbi:hypothetical protein IWW36_003018 [Coemansia brasiliensis]|uniref:Myb-like domain-containing protein n=1 Tax=Coemansia brasiliensis TaxID=2650707 RepID=A0A9W8LZD4_9FUNG|nr:hypothetical protein IWW36_003018 [Coemansia brasiliensis]
MAFLGGCRHLRVGTALSADVHIHPPFALPTHALAIANRGASAQHKQPPEPRHEPMSRRNLAEHVYPSALVGSPRPSPGPTPMSVPAAAAQHPKHNATHSEFYAVHHPPADSPTHIAMRRSQPPSPHPPSTSTTPLDPAAQPHASEAPAGYEASHAWEQTARPAFAGAGRHMGLFRRQGQFAPALPPIDAGDMGHPHMRHEHAAQPQAMHSPTVQARRQPHLPAVQFRAGGPHGYRHPGLALPPKADRTGKQPGVHRPYELQSPAPASRTFWNHYETGMLVQLWLEFEQQFLANKRNAGVWAQLAQRLTERSGRHRTVRECRIKWKNMWAKHRDLVNASHMGLDAKLREFPHFNEFSAIRQRSAQHHQTHANEGSEGKHTPVDDDRRASSAAADSPASSSAAAPPRTHTPSTPAYPHDPPEHGGGLALHHLLATPEQDPLQPTMYPPATDSSGPTVHDLPRMLHRLDCSLDSADREPGESVGVIIERMRALASTASAADIASTAQQIMGYVERESRRRQQQSERHHAVVTALADILARSSASSTMAPSAATSRRSSGVPPHHTRAGDGLDRLALILHPRETDDTHAEAPPSEKTS